MNIESNVQHKRHPAIKDREIGTNNTFHDTPSTEASCIVSLEFFQCLFENNLVVCRSLTILEETGP